LKKGFSPKTAPIQNQQMAKAVKRVLVEGRPFLDIERFWKTAVLEAEPFLREPLLEVELFSEVITSQIMKYQVMNI
jgi:hypothetical protein